MFSPDKFRLYDATHQLFALYIYRKFNGDTPDLSRLMDRLRGASPWKRRSIFASAIFTCNVSLSCWPPADRIW